MNTKPPIDTVDEPYEMTLVMPNGTTWENTRHKDSRLMVRARDFLTSLDARSAFSVIRSNLIWTSMKGKHELAIAEIDEKGSSWIYVRDVANIMGWKIAVEGRTVTLSE